ncbi:NUDIX hydrolase [Leifsonia sp. ZF2019]|uniref:NUDIX hydrolase n=1 Tax=Leifsonia sp. ZF2019 TaxID=2781978 RepID=UPI001CBB3FD5|nr:NUDIX hydrolase [Leifsonia sp. ZF2019]UAJ79104.1 NUDIX hydrolase [Leifsonia sp. ZF2019]
MDEQKWTRVSARTVYEGRMTIREHSVQLPDSTPGRYEVDESVPYGAAVLIRDGGDILLSRQYRFPVDGWIHDLPGGAGEDGEQPAEAARREAVEELGIVVGDLTPLQTFYPNPGRSAWPVHLFFAEAAGTLAPKADDPFEQVRCLRIPIADLASLVDRGEIVDPSLLIAWHTATTRGLLAP